MIRLVEQMVLNPPEGLLSTWRFYRIEYPEGYEGIIWLPPELDSGVIEDLLNPDKNAHSYQ